MLQLWDQLVDCICRPPRCVRTPMRGGMYVYVTGTAAARTEQVCRPMHTAQPRRDDYAPDLDLVGGRRGLFRVARFEAHREDVTLVSPPVQRTAPSLPACSWNTVCVCNPDVPIGCTGAAAGLCCWVGVASQEQQDAGVAPASQVNKRGLKLLCSHYIPKNVKGKDGRLPCVVYCHCNSGSRRDAEEAICILIPQGVSVFALDFAVREPANMSMGHQGLGFRVGCVPAGHLCSSKLLCVGLHAP